MAGRFVPVIHGAADGPDEADTREVAAEVAAALKRLGYETEIVHLGLDLSVLRPLAARKPFAVFNLVEALIGSDALAALPLPVLDHLNIRYTGARAEAYQLTLSKLATKERLRSAGLPTADWWMEGGAAPAGARVIVKSVSEHASKGLDAGSVVSGAEAAREILAREERFGGKFFAEAFVDGREFNISLIERDGVPRVLPIPEIVFKDWPQDRPRIVDYEAKWDASSPYYHKSPRRFGLDLREPALAQTLRDLALRAWHAFDLSGYARIDIRLDDGGAPKILEVNANPCLARDAGFMATAREAGLSFDTVIETIVSAALLSSAYPANPPPNLPQRGRNKTELAAADMAWRESVCEEDIARIGTLVAETGYFTAAEVDIAKELVEECLKKGEAASGYSFVLLEQVSALIGYACYGLTPGTETSYDLYWIVVASGLHGRGYGQRILQQVEQRIAALGGKKIYVDTSSTKKYAPTRGFYERSGFVRVATLHDFYRSGDSKVIYEKALKSWT